jgi:hypothetical protein
MTHLSHHSGKQANSCYTPGPCAKAIFLQLRRYAAERKHWFIASRYTCLTQRLQPNARAYLLATDAFLKHWPEENEIYPRYACTLHFRQRVAGNANDGRGPLCYRKYAPYLLRREFVRMRGKMHARCSHSYCNIRASVNQQTRLCAGNFRNVFQDGLREIRKMGDVQRLVTQLHEVHTILGPPASVSDQVSPVGNGIANHVDSVGELRDKPVALLS